MDKTLIFSGVECKPDKCKIFFSATIDKITHSGFVEIPAGDIPGHKENIKEIYIESLFRNSTLKGD